MGAGTRREGAGAMGRATKRRERTRTLERLQERWRGLEGEAEWTRGIVPDVVIWTGSGSS